MKITDMVLEKLHLLNERLDEQLIDAAVKDHDLSRQEAARFVEQRTYRKVSQMILQGRP